MDINRKILEELRHTSREEQKQILNAFEICKREPSVVVAMAVLRDTYIFQQMSKSFLMDYQERIAELESRVTELEEKCRGNDE